MNPGGTTEIIWHFAGYLHLIMDEVRARLDYDEMSYRAQQEDYVAKLPHYEFPADLDEMGSRGLKTPEPPFEARIVEGPPLPLHPYSIDPGKVALPKAPVLDKLLPQRGGGGGVGGEVLQEKAITVSYDDNGQQLQLEADQVNFMNDDDVFGTAWTHNPDWTHGADAAEVLEDLLEDAKAEIPAEIDLPLGTADVVAFVKAQDEAKAANGPDADDGTPPVEPGLYINGKLQPAGTERPEDASSEEPAPDLDAKGQWAELGGNIATNAAMIVDLSEAAPTLMVLGDYFRTDAIVQVNGYIDDDQHTFGPSTPADLVSGGNTADNIAEFIRNPGLHGEIAGNFGGPFWNVDIVHGDFFDLNLVTQHNYLRDNDIAAQQTSDAHFQLVAGDNALYNLFELHEYATSYDLIIVGGNYHGANFIFQTNLLLDSDILKMVAGGEGAIEQSAKTGGNALLNEASIESYGNDTFLPLSAEMSEAAAALAAGQGNLDLGYGNLFSGNGSSVLNVLYVTGDYYDINALWQVNVIADMDTAMQLISRSSSGAELTQHVSTGGNELTNFAAIIDVGSTFSFVGGDVYEDAILVQADLVTDDADTIINKNTDTLVAEVIAFTGIEDEHENSDVGPAFTTTPHDDVMGSVLT